MTAGMTLFLWTAVAMVAQFLVLVEVDDGDGSTHMDWLVRRAMYSSLCIVNT